MKEKYFAGLSVIFFIFLALNAAAYINCTPSSCPSGQIDNGVTCDGSVCTRDCIAAICNGDWTQVHSETVGWLDDTNEEHESTPTGHTPTDTTMCYNFTYQGSSTASNTDMNADAVPSGDCDTEAIGGFWDFTGGTVSSSPWFSGMNDYLGSTPDDSDTNYLLRIMRAHIEEDDDADYRTATQKKGKILCAPTTIACGLLNSSACDTDCYSRNTIMRVHQGYYNQTGSPDQTLYDNRECGNNAGGAHDYVNTNRLQDTTLYVYKATTYNQSYPITCDRTHEAPNATNVRVIPEIPNAGQDLFCNFTYSDPENLTEQNSTFSWWKNGVNQNINSQTLAKGNLTPGNQWNCTVLPSDGMLFGSEKSSANLVTVRNATQNPVFYVNTTAIWNESGYFGSEKQLADFGGQIAVALENCVADSQGYCNVSLTFSSNNTGVINISSIEIYQSNSSPANASVSASNASLSIPSLQGIYSNGTNFIFEFIINNTGQATISNIQWQFDTGDNKIINSTTNISLASGEKAYVYVAHNFSSEASYNIRFNATGISQSDTITASFSSTVTMANLLITLFNNTFQNTTNMIFEIKGLNNLNSNISGLRWSINTGNGSINTTNSFNLGANETIFIFAAKN